MWRHTDNGAELVVGVEEGQLHRARGLADCDLLGRAIILLGGALALLLADGGHGGGLVGEWSCRVA